MFVFQGAIIPGKVNLIAVSRASDTGQSRGSRTWMTAYIAILDLKIPAVSRGFFPQSHHIQIRILCPTARWRCDTG